MVRSAADPPPAQDPSVYFGTLVRRLFTHRARPEHTHTVGER
jgi:hypothetical protein